MDTSPRLSFRKPTFNEQCNITLSSTEEDYKVSDRSFEQNWRYVSDSKRRPLSDPQRRRSRLSEPKTPRSISNASLTSKQFAKTKPDIKHTYTSTLRYFLLRPQSENLHWRASQGKRKIKSAIRTDNYRNSNTNDKLVRSHSRHLQHRPATKHHQRETITAKIRPPMEDGDENYQYHGIANSRHTVKFPEPDIVRTELESSETSSPQPAEIEDLSINKPSVYIPHGSKLSDQEQHSVRFKQPEQEYGEISDDGYIRIPLLPSSARVDGTVPKPTSPIPKANKEVQLPPMKRAREPSVHEFKFKTENSRSLTLTSIQLQESKSDLEPTHTNTSTPYPHQLPKLEPRGPDEKLSVAMPKPVHDATLTSLEYCDFHNDKIIEYYCKVHEMVFCSACKTFKHGGCANVRRIKDVSKDVKESNALQKVMQKLKNLTMTITNIEQSNAQEQTKLRSEIMRCEKEICDLRQECNDVFNRLETEFSSALCGIESDEIKKLSTNMYTLKSAMLQVENVIKSIEMSTENGDNTLIFSAMTKGERMSAVVANTVQKVIENSYRVSLAIEPDNKLKQFLRSVTHFGEIKTNVTKPDDDSTQKPSSIKHMRIASHEKHTVHLKEDVNKCWITGSAFLKDGGLVLCDNFNECLKLLDNNFTIQHTLKLKSPPWDLVAVSETGIVVTIPEEQKLQFVTVNNMLVPTWSKRTRMMCFGVTIHEESIIVACHDNTQSEIMILDKYGHFQQKISIYQVKTEMLPYRVAVSNDGKMLFLTDQDSVSVTCMAMNGDILYQFANKNDDDISKYNTDDIWFPEKLLIDKDNNILVCDYLTHTVDILAEDGQKYKIQMTFDDGLKGGVRKVSSVSYRQADRTLVLGVWDSDLIHIYTLSK